MSNKIEEMEIIGKITSKSIGFDSEDIRDHIKKGKGSTSLFRLYGQIINVKYGDGDNGPWTKFIGQFEAVNLKDGNIVRSGAMFLPTIITGMVEADLVAAKAIEGFAGYQMAYEIGAKKSDIVIGYEFTVVNLMPDSEENDALLQLRNRLEVTKGLPKPKAK